LLLVRVPRLPPEWIDPGGSRLRFPASPSALEADHRVSGRIRFRRVASSPCSTLDQERSGSGDLATRLEGLQATPHSPTSGRRQRPLLHPGGGDAIPIVLVAQRWDRPDQRSPAIGVGPTAAPAQAGETAIPHRNRCTGSAHTAPGPVCCRHALPDLSLQGRFHRRVTTTDGRSARRRSAQGYPYMRPRRRRRGIAWYITRPARTRTHRPPRGAPAPASRSPTLARRRT